MRALLTLPVPDLTGLAARAGGVFPRDRVIATIDGRAVPAAHGGPMPILGELLRGDALLVETGERARLLAVADWRETVQTAP